MRLIDADDLFPYGAVPYFENDGFATADMLYGIIKDAPTVGAVEVVRCKDCKHRPVWRSCQGKREDDFCSYGERKEI